MRKSSTFDKIAKKGSVLVKTLIREKLLFVDKYIIVVSDNFNVGKSLISPCI